MIQENVRPTRVDLERTSGLTGGNKHSENIFKYIINIMITTETYYTARCILKQKGKTEELYKHESIALYYYETKDEQIMLIKKPLDGI